MWKSDWKKKTKVIVSSILAALTAIIIISAILAPPSIELSDMTTNSEFIIESENYQINGKVFPSASTLTVNDKTVIPNSKGEFSTTIATSEGVNLVRIKAVGDDKVTEKTYTFRRLTATEIAERNKNELEKKNNQKKEQNKPQENKKPQEKPKQKSQNANPRYYWHKVTKVVDGDTVKAMVDGKEESIRIIGMDSPESVDPRKTVQCFGVEASSKANEFLSSKWIQLESDSSQGNRDKYNRLLRYVWFDKGTDFGRRMIEEGYAHEYTYNTPYSKQTQYKSTYKIAQNSKKGLWSPSTCNGQKEKPAPTPAPTASPKPTPAPTPTPTSNCNPNYSPCVPNSPTDLNCPDIGFRVTVLGTDVYRLDNDSDGIGCDSY